MNNDNDRRLPDPVFFDPNRPQQGRSRKEWELMGDLAPLGATEEEIAAQRKEAARLRGQAQPGMRQVGDVFIKSNPLEHMAWGMNQFNSRWNEGEANRRRREMGTDTQAIIADWLRRADTYPATMEQRPVETPI